MSRLHAASAALAGCALSLAALGAPVSGSGLLGARVTSPQGERLGTLRDLAIDTEAAAVRYAIVEQPETTRRERELRAVPPTALRPGLAQDQLVLDLAAAGQPLQAPNAPPLMRLRTLLGAPIDHPAGMRHGVIRDLVVDLESAQVRHALVALQSAPQGVTQEVPLAALRFPPGEQRAILTLGNAPGPLTASALLGMQVRDAAAGTRGRLDELVVDLSNNRVHYAVIDMGDRLLTEPMRNLRYAAGSNDLVLEGRTQQPVAPRAGMTLVRASSLLGWEVESQPGLILGRVVDFVVDLQSGRVAFAGVRLHADPSAGLRAVPLDAFAVYARRENLVFTGEPDELKAARGFAPESMSRPDHRFVERQTALAERLAPGSASVGGTTAATQAANPLFERLDRDGSGLLEDAELERRAAESRNWLAIDLDGDGRISREEFTGLRE